ncbi:ABC1 kinase family protein [Streptomonospora nanhaiensis]|uniref:Ubiquinone biosynthesis protein n=1 Tax=Streptomonospora nanhaiensis TaxID=1323731 RepID=A0A853BIR2_9ACTN|nr:AarF/UbiB family protein [Streptomonospora nanhaiensis]MBV2364209.1 AarF/ABC1/UbiB kinase family protein [Streptomonospora nanhaiensis]MBX9386671.1 AarF/ABC1/UbiB kinase family protein [Streptomonospora nanhaiensis]NYI95163.1 ubiquinone biosynthesis protein [Streptomonospora nanhaiensis]
MHPAAVTTLPPALLAPVVWIAGLATAMAVAWVAGLVLGIRVSVPRALAAGFAGFAVGGVTTELVSRAPGEAVPIGVVSSGGVVIAAMAVLVVGEVLFPTGSRLRPLARAKGVRDAAGRALRYAAILRIAARHGLGPYLAGRRAPSAGDRPRQRLAAALAAALEDGGAAFVKLGQVLATRRDLLPPVFVAELSRLHNRVATVPAEQVRAVLREELGAPVEEVFAEFGAAPLASASIAQAHTARLRDGTAVVVKVQRPGIARAVRRDLDILGRLARFLHARAAWARSMGVRDLADGFAEALTEELDFRVEAANIAAVAATTDTARVVVPRVFDAYTTRRVLVMERLPGVALSAAGTVPEATQEDRDALARTLLETLLTQVTEHGVFHADPHPGNVLLLPDGRLGLLDFGAVGRLDAGTRECLRFMMAAIDRGDPAGLTDSLLALVPPEDAREVDADRLRRALGRFMVQHLHEGAVPDVRMFTDLVLLPARHRLRLPPEVAAVFRALGTLEGVLRALSPTFDLVGQARRYAAERVGERLRPDSLRATLTDEVVALLPTLRRLPRRLDRIAATLEEGRLRVEVGLLGGGAERAFVAGLAHQAMLTLLAIASGALGVALLAVPGGPGLTPRTSFFDLLGYLLMVVGGALVLRVLLAVYRRPATGA